MFEFYRNDLDLIAKIICQSEKSTLSPFFKNHLENKENAVLLMNKNLNVIRHIDKNLLKDPSFYRFYTPSCICKYWDILKEVIPQCQKDAPFIIEVINSPSTKADPVAVELLKIDHTVINRLKRKWEREYGQSKSEWDCLFDLFPEEFKKTDQFKKIVIEFLKNEDKYCIVLSESRGLIDIRRAFPKAILEFLNIEENLIEVLKVVDILKVKVRLINLLKNNLEILKSLDFWLKLISTAPTYVKEMPNMGISNCAKGLLEKLENDNERFSEPILLGALKECVSFDNLPKSLREDEGFVLKLLLVEPKHKSQLIWPEMPILLRSLDTLKAFFSKDDTLQQDTIIDFLYTVHQDNPNLFYEFCDGVLEGQETEWNKELVTDIKKIKGVEPSAEFSEARGFDFIRNDLGYLLWVEPQKFSNFGFFEQLAYTGYLREIFKYTDLCKKCLQWFGVNPEYSYLNYDQRQTFYNFYQKVAHHFEQSEEQGELCKFLFNDDVPFGKWKLACLVNEKFIDYSSLDDEIKKDHLFNTYLVVEDKNNWGILPEECKTKALEFDIFYYSYICPGTTTVAISPPNTYFDYLAHLDNSLESKKKMFAFCDFYLSSPTDLIRVLNHQFSEKKIDEKAYEEWKRQSIFYRCLFTNDFKLKDSHSIFAKLQKLPKEEILNFTFEDLAYLPYLLAQTCDWAGFLNVDSLELGELITSNDFNFERLKNDERLHVEMLKALGETCSKDKSEIIKKLDTITPSVETIRKFLMPFEINKLGFIEGTIAFEYLLEHHKDHLIRGFIARCGEESFEQLIDWFKFIEKKQKERNTFPQICKLLDSFRNDWRILDEFIPNHFIWYEIASDEAKDELFKQSVFSIVTAKKQPLDLQRRIFSVVSSFAIIGKKLTAPKLPKVLIKKILSYYISFRSLEKSNK